MFRLADLTPTVKLSVTVRYYVDDPEIIGQDEKGEPIYDQPVTKSFNAQFQRLSVSERKKHLENFRKARKLSKKLAKKYGADFDEEDLDKSDAKANQEALERLQAFNDLALSSLAGWEIGNGTDGEILPQTDEVRAMLLDQVEIIEGIREAYQKYLTGASQATEKNS